MAAVNNFSELGHRGCLWVSYLALGCGEPAQRVGSRPEYESLIEMEEAGGGSGLVVCVGKVNSQVSHLPSLGVG